MKKSNMFLLPLFYGVIFIIATMLLIILSFDLYIFLATLSAVIVVWFYTYKKTNKFKNNRYNFLRSISYIMDIGERENLETFPMPIVCVSDEYNILWYNSIFKKFVLDNKDAIHKSVFDYIFDLDIKKSVHPGGFDCRDKISLYTAYSIVKNIDGQDVYTIFFKDDTSIKKKAIAYEMERPCILTLVIDNFDDYVISLKDSEKSQIVNSVENIFETVILGYKGKVNKANIDKFTSVVSYSAIMDMRKNKFKVFDDIKKVHYESKAPITFSIGVGIDGGNILKNNEEAKQALDMALGRGGDQCVIKTGEKYEFFGDSLSNNQRTNKVKARFMANAIAEIINTSSNVIVMGHKFADFDSLGSAIGIHKMATALGKDVSIAIDYNKNACKSIIDYIETNGEHISLIDEEEALQKIDEQTLLVIVDTNAKSLIQFYSVYEKCENIVVIDHHRKVVDHINNSVILYHEPSASSTCEMVAEMFMYFGFKYKNVDNITAECLLGGIALDTKNFSLRTSVRTFDAASYLKQWGADTINVRKFFSQSSSVYRIKNETLANVEIYKNCGISVVVDADEENTDIRIIVPQVADEMLQLNGVISSFVFYEDNGIYYISARSFGEINVQLITEKLGGGGHMTMAGAQIKDVSTESCIEKIKAAIDEYFNEKGVEI